MHNHQSQDAFKSMELDKMKPRNKATVQHLKANYLSAQDIATQIKFIRSSNRLSVNINQVDLKLKNIYMIIKTLIKFTNKVKT
jgi:hypothetical protein